MKATIVRPDGTRIGVDGTAEEIAKALALGSIPVQVTPTTWWLPQLYPQCTCGATTAWCPMHGPPASPHITFTTVGEGERSFLVGTLRQDPIA